MVTTTGDSGGGTNGGTTSSGTTTRRRTTRKKTPTHHATPDPRRHTAAQVVAAVARELGIPPQVALAIAMNESGLNPHSVGDNGTSFGLFQLHEGGELGNHSASWAFNPYNNARTALAVVAREHALNPNRSWGEIAAAAQRPADPAGYAANVNGILAGYHAVGGDPVHYFAGHAISGAAFTSSGAGKEANALNSPGLVAQFGYLSAYLNNPELGGILRDYAQNHQGNTAWLLAQLEKTNWWKTHSQTARELSALQKVDPASYKQQWAQQRHAIATEAAQMGVPIRDNRLDQLTTTSLFSGWDSSQITQAIGAEFHYDPDAKFTGAAGQTLQKLKALSGEYLVPLHDQALQTWTRQILEGRKTSADDYSNYLAEQAKTLFPWMSKAIDQGVTPTQYLQPYQQAAAQTLELDPAAVDLTKAKWRRLFETVDDKGQRTERGLANAMTLMRTDPIYNYDATQGARQEAASLAQQIAQQFGFAAA